MKAVRVDVCGAAEQMSVKEVPLPEPNAGEVRIKLKACGINFIDTYHRSGLYPLPLPSGIGLEAAAKIVEISGGKVAGFIFVINLFDLPGEKLLKKKNYIVSSLVEFPGH